MCGFQEPSSPKELEGMKKGRCLGCGDRACSTGFVCRYVAESCLPADEEEVMPGPVLIVSYGEQQRVHVRCLYPGTEEYPQSPTDMPVRDQCECYDASEKTLDDLFREVRARQQCEAAA